MSDEKMIQLAVKLQKLGVSHTGIVELLSKFKPEEIEKQLTYLPYRKAKRPEAFIIDAVRRNYSAPKEFYAQVHPHSTSDADPLDEDLKSPPGHPASDPEGYGTAHPPSGTSPNDGLPARGRTVRLELPEPGIKDGPAE